MTNDEENHILRYNYECLEKEYNQYREAQDRRERFLQWKLEAIKEELKNVLLGNSYNKIEDIMNMKLEDWKESE